MVSSLLIFAVVLVAVVLAGHLLFRRQSDVTSIADWELKKHDIDVRTFEALTNPDEENRLRDCLSAKQFRYFQRRRLALALRFLSLAEENAAMLMSLAQRARTNRDPILMRRAEEILAVALQLRLQLPLARLYLFVKWLVPSCTASVPSFERSYRELLHGVLQFQPEGRPALV